MVSSLERACLNLIAEEFETFHTAFLASHDQILDGHFEFLQRKFTAELILELIKRSNLKDNYLDFLLNVHLKSLEGEWFKFSRYRDSMQDIICRLPNLRKLTLLSKCSDEILEKVAQFCPKIVVIDASGSSVTDTGLKYLCKNENGEIPCPELKEFSINSTRVTDEGLTCLIKDLTFLEFISHPDVPRILYFIYKEDFLDHKEVPTYNLVNLHLYPSQINLPYYTDLLKMCLTICPKLKSVACFITEEKQLNFFNNVSLETLDLRVLSKKLQLDINTFLKNNGSNLVHLYISNCKISIRDLAANCPKLQNFSIQNNTFLDDPDDSQISFQNLTDCCFTDLTINSATNKAVCLLLSTSPNLENLCFISCELSSQIKTYILKCCQKNCLNNLSFWHTRVEMKFVKDIILCSPSLKTLDLQDCGYNLHQRMELTEFVKEIIIKPNIYVDKYWIIDYDYDENRADLE